MSLVAHVDSWCEVVSDHDDTASLVPWERVVLLGGHSHLTIWHVPSLYSMDLLASWTAQTILRQRGEGRREGGREREGWRKVGRKKWRESDKYIFMSNFAVKQTFIMLLLPLNLVSFWRTLSNRLDVVCACIYVTDRDLKKERRRKWAWSQGVQPRPQIQKPQTTDSCISDTARVMQ